MRAVVYREFGGPDVLEVVELDDPAVSADTMIVRVEAAGVNPIDAKLRGGMRASGPLDAPRRVGMDGAGTIVSIGADVEGFRIGERIAFRQTSGSYAELVTVKPEHATPLPASVSAAAAAGIGIPFGTAYQALRSLGVSGDDVLLVHGGSGSVGQAAIQFARLWGADVIATSSPARFDELERLGATPVAYGGAVTELVRATGKTPTVALDAAGSDEALESSVALVADRSRIATVVRGADAPGYGIRAFGGGSPEPLTDGQSFWRAEALPITVSLLAAGAFQVVLGPSFGLDDAALAHEAIAHGAVGKITITPNP